MHNESENVSTNRSSENISPSRSENLSLADVKSEKPDLDAGLGINVNEISRTRAELANKLVDLLQMVILGFLIFSGIHYFIYIIVLVCGGDVSSLGDGTLLKDIFAILLTFLGGLLGSVIGFYFASQEKQGKK